MLTEKLKGYRIVLASKSPRRKELLTELGLSFDVQTFDTDESYPAEMPVGEVPVFLAEQKARPFESSIDDEMLVITADTIVHIEGEILGKPADYDDAFRMLSLLSGKWHQVATGVCIVTKQKKVSFTSQTNVLFKHLTNEEIDYYITNYKPYDKAGAYGIQEWIGFIAVEQIKGSYFNVMGLPVQHLYEELCLF
jgi:septum formation protein